MSKEKNVKEEVIKDVEKDVNKVEETEVITPETTGKKSKKERFKNFAKKAKRCAKYALAAGIGAVVAIGIGALALYAAKIVPDDAADVINIKGENGEDLYLITPKGYLDESDETSKDDDKDEN